MVMKTVATCTGKTKLLEETGNAGGEDGERSSVWLGSVYCNSADNDEGDNA